MYIWRYNLGVWEKNCHFLKDWDDTMPEFENFLDANGFENSRSIQWGEEYDEERIMFYPNKDDLSWLGDIPTLNSSFYFLIPDHPSFLKFKKEFKHLQKNKINEFIEMDLGFFVRRDSIDTITINKSSEKEYLVFKDNKDEIIHTNNFSYYDLGNNRKCGGRAKGWLKENLGIE